MADPALTRRPRLPFASLRRGKPACAKLYTEGGGRPLVEADGCLREVSGVRG